MSWSAVFFWCSTLLCFRAVEASVPAPSNVRAIKVESSSITVQWNKITSGTSSVLSGYRVRYYISNNSSDERLESTGNSSDQLHIGNLRPYTNYTIMVSGYTNAGDGNWSSPLTVLTDEAVPSAPANITVLKAESPTTVYLEWNPLLPEKANGIILGYMLAYLRVADIRDYQTKLVLIQYSRTNPRNFTFSGLQPYTEYFVGVAPYNSKGYKVSSEWVSLARKVTTPEGVPSVPPDNVSARFLCDQYKLAVFWDAVAGQSVNGDLQGYLITLKTAGNTSLSHTVSSEKKSAEILVNECKNYSVAVAAFTRAGTGSNSDNIVAVSLCPCGPPRILHANISVIAREGEEVYVPCAYYGRPPIQHASWMKDGSVKVLPDEEHILIYIPTADKQEWLTRKFSLSSNFSYHISYADKKDSGIYTCVMSNGFGNASVTVTLTVSADFASVEFTLVLPNVTYSEALEDRNSMRFSNLENVLRSEILKLFTPKDPYEVNSAKVLKFRNGSIVADMTVAVSLPNIKDKKTAISFVKKKLAEVLGGERRTLGNLEIKLLEIKGVPVRPGKPTAEDIDTEKIKVSWNPPVYHEAYSITGYTLKYKTFGAKGDFIAVVETVGPSPLSGTIENLESGTAYEVVVVAHNAEGSSAPSEILEVTTSNSYVHAIVIPIVILSLLSIGAFVWYRIRRRRREMRVDETFDIDRIDRGHAVRYGVGENVYSGSTDPSGRSYDVIDIDKNWWEIPRNSIKIGDELGSGAFGEVKKGYLIVGDKTEECAVKMLKRFATEREFRDLLNELNMMVQVGDHPNVVSLIGASSIDGPLWVVVKLAENGSLLSYLQKIRSSQNYQNIAGPNDELTLAKKLKLAFGIAKGMEHLSKKKCVHRDLAARNVLLGKNDTPMVSDFGLSRDIYESGMYESTSGGKLPVKWMAIEAIEDYHYDYQSDVWAYGVTLWEIETKGLIPYPGLNGLEILKELKNGYRLEKPDSCSEEMYQIMLDCWKSDPSKRPTFEELVKRIESFLQDVVGYLEVDVPERKEASAAQDTPYDEVRLPEA